MDARKYYVQNYDFTMLGYLIDEDEFEVKPAIQRVTQLVEVDTHTLKKKRKVWPENPSQFPTEFLFMSGVTSLSEKIDFTANMSILSTDNITSYDVYINGNFYGTDVNLIQITFNDILNVQLVKEDNTKAATIKFDNKLF